MRIYLVEPDAGVAERVQNGVATAGFHVAGIGPSAEAALPALLAECYDAVVIDVASSRDITATVRKLAQGCPESCVIVTGAGTPAAVMSKAVAAGARGFLIKPYSTDDLVATIHDALETLRSLSVPKASKPERRSRGRIIAAYSPKGGVGTTTVASNLAVALAARPNTRVALIDLDLQFGDVGAALDLRSANSIAEVIGHEVDKELIDETFVRHASGIRVLLAPADLALVGGIDSGEVVSMLEQLPAHFDFVVCDLWSSFEELTERVLTLADRVLLVMTPELPALRNAQRVLGGARAEAHLDEKALVVVNRYPGKAGLSRDDITRALGRPIAAAIPSEGVGVTDAINRGLSLLDSRLRIKIARHYHELATLVAGDIAVRDTRAAPAPAATTAD
jgi:pilus assembly protein CpaE